VDRSFGYPNSDSAKPAAVLEFADVKCNNSCKNPHFRNFLNGTEDAQAVKQNLRRGKRNWWES